MKETTTKKIQRVFTVVIIDRFEWDDLSTVSFEKFDDAVDYCLTELDKVDNEEVREELVDQMYYHDGDTEYYIEEANLIH